MEGPAPTAIATIPIWDAVFLLREMEAASVPKVRRIQNKAAAREQMAALPLIITIQPVTAASRVLVAIALMEPLPIFLATASLSKTKPAPAAMNLTPALGRV